MRPMEIVDVELAAPLEPILLRPGFAEALVLTAAPGLPDTTWPSR